LTREKQNEVCEYRKEELKRKSETDDKGDVGKKIAALEARIEELSQITAYLISSFNKEERHKELKLLTTLKGALKPLPGFTQRK